MVVPSRERRDEEMNALIISKRSGKGCKRVQMAFTNPAAEKQ
jgi:hypothetical protein